MPTRNASATPSIEDRCQSPPAHSALSIGVSVEPGATTLQRTPCRATSRPRTLVNMVEAALDAA